jgi:lysophospholipase L1-like esterase
LNSRCLLCFGDSFVNGAGDPDALGWAGRLAAAAWGQGLPLSYYNLGVRGETTADVAKRLRGETVPRMIPGADNCIVIAVGANDVDLAGGTRALSLEDSIAALGRILEAASELGARTHVVGPGPTGIADHDERSRELGRAFASFCSDRGVPFTDVLDDLLADERWGRSAGENDGIHPGAQGYAALTGLLVQRGLLEWLGAAKPPSA